MSLHFMLIDGNSVGYANQYSHTLTAQGMQVKPSAELSARFRSASENIQISFPSSFGMAGRSGDSTFTLTIRATV